MGLYPLSLPFVLRVMWVVSACRFTNALILTTSNLSESVDGAFLDRADLKLFLPPPPASAIYSIFLSCIRELRLVRSLERQLFPIKDHVNIPEKGPLQTVPFAEDVL